MLRRVHEFGVEDAVDVPGFVATETVDELMGRALCLLLPSRREGYGLVVIEAAARGTPSIVVPGPDNAAVELIEDGVNGVIAPSASPDDLAAAIVRVHDAGEPLRARRPRGSPQTPGGCPSSARSSPWRQLLGWRRPATAAPGSGTARRELTSHGQPWHASGSARATSSMLVGNRLSRGIRLKARLASRSGSAARAARLAVSVYGSTFIRRASRTAKSSRASSSRAERTS